MEAARGRLVKSCQLVKEFELVKQCSREEKGLGRRDEAGGRKATNMTSLPRKEGSLATKIFEGILKETS